MSRAWLMSIAAGLVAAALWYIQAPPRSVDAFEERASHTAEALSSQLETARLWAGAVERGDATHAAAAVGLQEADGDAAELASDFSELQPPGGAGRSAHRARAPGARMTRHAPRCQNGDRSPSFCTRAGALGNSG